MCLKLKEICYHSISSVEVSILPYDYFQNLKSEDGIAVNGESL